ncbi:MAG: DUF2752 domain-containing protein [Sphingobacteriales bacterium]
MLLNYIPLQLFCSRLVFINWLQNHLIPCPFKYLTGIDCPGCGFQRSVLALFQGDLHKSFTLYPPTIPLLLFFTYGLADKYLKLDNSKNTLKKTLFVINGTIVLVSYSIKILHLYAHYTISV